jgi:uncharacterized membrane protein YidH (DUF202 family)
MDPDRKRQLRESGERDLMNWGRTALTLLSTGIGFERALAVVTANNAHLIVDPFDILRILAISLIVLGLVVVGLAARAHLRILARLRHELAPEPPDYSISLILAAGILVIFTTALVTVLSFRDVVRTHRSADDGAGPRAIVAGLNERFDPATPAAHVVGVC